jgi:hypothetical protein
MIYSDFCNFCQYNLESKEQYLFLESYPWLILLERKVKGKNEQDFSKFRFVVSVAFSKLLVSTVLAELI